MTVFKTKVHVLIIIVPWFNDARFRTFLVKGNLVNHKIALTTDRRTNVCPMMFSLHKASEVSQNSFTNLLLEKFYRGVTIPLFVDAW